MMPCEPGCLPVRNVVQAAGGGLGGNPGDPVNSFYVYEHIRDGSGNPMETIQLHDEWTGHDIGDPAAVVAIIDTGVDNTTHQAFAATPFVPQGVPPIWPACSAAPLVAREGRTPASRGSGGGWTTADGKLHVSLTAGEATLLAGDFPLTALDPREVFAKRIDDTKLLPS